ncbi:ABC transporter substrate-binding protein [Paraclostridium bifermentans]|uniref:ABC transporter substrate-binding protein n=1 Tax=Paraclostridium bifermentans TaxID=1490 RepID=UPI00374F7FE6
MFLKRGIITGAVLSLVLGLTGCSSTGGNSADGKVELRYAIWDKTHMEAVETLIDGYEKENPNVDIKVEQYSFADYWTKMETAAAGGSAPDIYWMNAVNFNKYADNGMLVNMKDYIKDKNVDMSQYLESLSSLYSYKGDQYGIPTFWDNNILMVNTKLMEEYGIPEPKENWNWDEMIAWLTDAKSKLPKDIYPFTSYATESTQSGVFNEVASAGGKVISDDKTKAMLTTPETKEGFKKYYDLVKSDLHSPYDITLEVTAGTLFKSEKALVLQMGSYGLLPYSDKEQAQVAGNFKLYEIPTIKEGNKSKTVIHGLGNVISSNSKHPEEAFDFINYMSSEESMKKYTELALVPQAHKNVQDLFGKVMKEKTGIDTSVMSKVAENAMPLPNSFETSKWDKAIVDNVTKFMQDEISLDQALENAQKEMQSILDKEKK